MKKINDIEQLQEILQNIIITQDCDEIKNFNTLYDYSDITDISYLWEKIIKNLSKKEINISNIDWKNIKFPILDTKNIKIKTKFYIL